MRLKNILLVVSDVEQSKKFYQDFFGLRVINDNDDYVMMSEGLGNSKWDSLRKNRLQNPMTRKHRSL